MLKIGEFSKLCRVSARMLRYYDRCNLLPPAKVDKFTGYRLYSPAQIPVLFRIVQLRDMGFGVEEMAEILPRFGDRSFMMAALERKNREVLAAIAEQQEKLANIATLSGQIAKETQTMVYEVKLEALPAVKVLALREVLKSPEDEPVLWEKLAAFAAENGVECGSGGYSIYHDEEYKESDVDIEVAVPVAAGGKDAGEFRFRELPGIAQAATVRFSGGYEGYGEAMEKLALWVHANGYEFAGSVRGHGIVLPGEDVHPQDYLTELQLPVKSAAER